MSSIESQEEWNHRFAARYTELPALTALVISAPRVCTIAKGGTPSSRAGNGLTLDVSEKRSGSSQQSRRAGGRAPQAK